MKELTKMKRFFCVLIATMLCSTGLMAQTYDKQVKMDADTYVLRDRGMIISSNDLATVGGDLSGMNTIVTGLRGFSIPTPGGGDVGKAYIWDGGAWTLATAGGGSSTSEWGMIIGTITNQTDLWSYLNRAAYTDEYNEFSVSNLFGAETYFGADTVLASGMVHRAATAATTWQAFGGNSSGDAAAAYLSLFGGSALANQQGDVILSGGTTANRGDVTVRAPAQNADIFIQASGTGGRIRFAAESFDEMVISKGLIEIAAGNQLSALGYFYAGGVSNTFENATYIWDDLTVSGAASIAGEVSLSNRMWITHTGTSSPVRVISGGNGVAEVFADGLVYYGEVGKWIVPSTRDIQEVVDMASSGDVIELGPGTWNTTTAISIAKPLTIRSAGGPASTVISATGLDGTPGNRVAIDITSSAVSIEGLTLTFSGIDGLTGIQFLGGSPTLSNGVVRNCIVMGYGTYSAPSAGNGKAIVFENASGEVSDTYTEGWGSGTFWSGMGVRLRATASASGPLSLNCFNVRGVTRSGTTVSSAFEVRSELTAPTTTMNVYDSVGISPGGTYGRAAVAHGAGATFNATRCTFNGGNGDAVAQNNGIMNLTDTVLVNNDSDNNTGGTTALLGTLYSGGLKLGGHTEFTASNLYDIGTALMPARTMYANTFDAIGSAYKIDGVEFAFTNAAGGVVLQAAAIQTGYEWITNDIQLTLSDAGKVYIVEGTNELVVSVPTNSSASDIGMDFEFVNITTNILTIDAPDGFSIDDSDPGSQIYSGIDDVNSWPWSSVKLKQADSNWWHVVYARGDWTTTGTNSSPVPSSPYATTNWVIAQGYLTDIPVTNTTTKRFTQNELTIGQTLYWYGAGANQISIGSSGLIRDEVVGDAVINLRDGKLFNNSNISVWQSEGTATNGDEIVNYDTMVSYVAGAGGVSLSADQTWTGTNTFNKRINFGVSGYITENDFQNGLEIFDVNGVKAMLFRAAGRNLYNNVGESVLFVAGEGGTLNGSYGAWDYNTPATNGHNIVNYQTMTNWVTQEDYGDVVAANYNVFTSSNRFNGTMYLPNGGKILAGPSGTALSSPDETTLLNIGDSDISILYAGNNSADFKSAILHSAAGGVWQTDGTATNGDEIVNYQTATNLFAEVASYNVYTSSNKYSHGNWDVWLAGPVAGVQVSGGAGSARLMTTTHVLDTSGAARMSALEITGMGTVNDTADSTTEIVNYQTMTNWVTQNAGSGDVVAANYNEFDGSNRFNEAVYIAPFKKFFIGEGTGSSWFDHDLSVGSSSTWVDSQGHAAFRVSEAQREMYDDDGTGIMLVVDGTAPVLQDNGDGGIWHSEGTATAGLDIVNYDTMTNHTSSLDSFGMLEQSSDPSDPAEGKSVIWQSDGTGFGDDGDICIMIQAGGVVKTNIWVDFSALP